MDSLHKQFIVNKKGKKTAVILPYSTWQKILEIFEEYDDICAYDRAKAKPSIVVPLVKRRVGKTKMGSDNY